MAPLPAGAPTTPVYQTADFASLEKNFPAALSAHLAGVSKGKRVEIWFQML